MDEEPVNVFSDSEIRDALGNDPELLAIADAIAQTRAEPVRRKRGHRTVVLLAAAAAVVVPALAFTNVIPGVSDWFSSPKAPQQAVVSFESLEQGAPAGMDPRVLASEARTLLEVRLADGTSARLFVAPTHEGGFCLEIEGFGGGCNAAREIPFDAGFAAKRFPQGPAIVYGSSLIDRAVEAEIRPAAGSARRVALTRVSSPIDAAFFVGDLPEPANTFPIHVSLLDADGNAVAERTIPPPPQP
jgi:hypothetical protein